MLWIKVSITCLLLKKEAPAMSLWSEGNDYVVAEMSVRTFRIFLFVLSIKFFLDSNIPKTFYLIA